MYNLFEDLNRYYRIQRHEYKYSAKYRSKTWVKKVKMGKCAILFNESYLSKLKHPFCLNTKHGVDLNDVVVMKYKTQNNN